MGRKDLYQSDFYENPERFSDIVNGVLFGGRQIVKPEELEEADSVVVSPSEKGSDSKVICDKIRKWRGQYFAIMTLENQSYVDYGMVLRNMKAEAIGYEKQKKDLFSHYRKQGVKYKKDEYLSMLKKEQKLIPIITLVIYLGGDQPWDGARSLYELLEIDDTLKPFINDYKLNLFDYHEHQDFSVFKTENRILFEVLSCLKDKEKLKQSIYAHPEWYDELDEESTKAILAITGINIELEKIKGKKKGGEQMYKLCKALADLGEEQRREGLREGLRNALEKIMNNLKVPLEEAMNILEIPEEEREYYR